MFVSGCVALVTGAASGIGAATVKGLSQHGVEKFVLIDRDLSRLVELVGKIQLDEDQILICEQDVADPIGWTRAQALIDKRFGRVDLAVASAGISYSCALADHDFEAWRRVLSVNLDGVFLTLQCSMQFMKRGQSGGSIVVVSSASGVKAEKGIAAYSASKAGAAQLAYVAAKEGAADNVRVNVIAPGGVETPIWSSMPFFRDMVSRLGSEQAAFRALAQGGSPLGRFSTAEEIAGHIIHLLSDASRCVTGSIFLVDGGYSL